MPYQVKLPTFEGPLDLLLHLIKKNRYNIFDIPITQITQQYLDYLEQMQSALDFTTAGEFLVEAANLLSIKAKMLLPKPQEEAAPKEDPRKELVQRLIEYEVFKNAADGLAQREILGHNVFKRGVPVEKMPREEKLDIEHLTLDLLIETVREIIRQAPQQLAHEIHMERISLQDRISEIVEILKMQQSISFLKLLPIPLVRYEIVLTLLAILELAKLRILRIRQPLGKEIEITSLVYVDTV